MTTKYPVGSTRLIRGVLHVKRQVSSVDLGTRVWHVQWGRPVTEWVPVK